MTEVPEYKLDAKTLRLIGMRIRKVREQRGWSQEKLAEVAGMHDRTIGKIDRGQMNLSVLTLLKICKALDCSPNRLLDV